MPEATTERASEQTSARAAGRIAVRVTDDAVRWVRAGHPWIFADSVIAKPQDAHPGDLAVVFDRKRRFQAIGLYDPTSPIRVRVLHHGKPTPIDDNWWTKRIGDAVTARRSLSDSTSTTGIRCINGENDGLGGLIVDRYADVGVIKIYTAAWLAHLDTIVPIIAQATGANTIVLRLARNVQTHLSSQAPGGVTDGTTVFGTAPSGPVLFRENGLVVEADVTHGQKTGYFLDQRDNRRLVGEASRGARVLDVFSAAGGFSLAAAAGGATSVLSVDASGPALAATRRNLGHNSGLATVRNCRHTTRQGDAFEIMADLATRGERFDIVVVDPPSFAHDRAAVPRALRAYGRLAELALPLVANDGMLVTASCSSRVSAEEFFATVHAAAQRSGYALDEIRRTGHAVDHPIGFPEGAYLKALFARPRRLRNAGLHQQGLHHQHLRSEHRRR